MIRESQIKFEAGDYWVLEDKPGLYLVMQNVGTHSLSLAAFKQPKKADGLSLATAYAAYLARRFKERN